MCDVSELEAAKLNDTFASDKEPYKWVLVGIDFSGRQPKAFIHAKGDTSVDEMKTRLSNDEILWVSSVFGICSLPLTLPGLQLWRHKSTRR